MDVPAGESVLVVQVTGGHGLAGRLEALGIRPGTRVRKLSSTFMRGPVTVEVYGTKVAIGYGMARKILVEPRNERLMKQERVPGGEDA